MELLQLKYFIHVAKLEHISKAAEELYISQPALSLTLRRLEKELGVPLFQKEGRNIKLTKYGKTFLSQVEPAYTQIQDAVNRLKQASRLDAEKRIVIYAPPLYTYPELLQSIRETCPDVVISLVTSTVEAAENQLRNRELDIAFFMTFSDEQVAPEFAAVPLHTAPLVAALPASHPLSRCKEIALEQLAGLPMAGYQAGFASRPLLDNYLKQRGISFQVAFESTSVRAILEYLRAVPCFALMMEHAFQRESSADVVGLPLSPAVTATMQMVYLPPARPITLQVVQVIQDYFEKTRNTLRGAPPPGSP